MGLRVLSSADSERSRPHCDYGGAFVDDEPVGLVGRMLAAVTEPVDVPVQVRERRQVRLESRDALPCADEKKLETEVGGVTPEPLDLLGDVSRRDRIMARFLAWCRTHGS